MSANTEVVEQPPDGEMSEPITGDGSGEAAEPLQDGATGPKGFSALRMWPAEGARVGLTTCLYCGAAILIDPSDKFEPMQVHLERHIGEVRTPEQLQVMLKLFGYEKAVEAARKEAS